MSKAEVLSVNRFGYKFKGQLYPRVTTIKGILGAGEALIDWAAKQVDADVKALVKQYRDGQLGIEGLLISLLDDNLCKAHIRNRDAKADYGTLFHDLAESCAKGIPYDIPTHLLPAAEAFLAWEQENKPKTLFTEVTIISRTHGYAGKLDRIAEINGEVILMDYKTSKGVYKEFALQMAAYRYGDFIAWPDGNETPLPPIDACAVLHVKPEGSVELLRVEAGPDQFKQFLNCLDLYRWRKTQPDPEPYVRQYALDEVFA